MCTSYLPVLGRILKGQGKRAKNGTHLYPFEIMYWCLCQTNEIQERFKGEVNESHLTKISNPRSWRQMKCICTFSLLGKQKKREDPTFSAFLREIHQHHFRAPFHFCAPFFWGRYTNTFCAPFHFCAPFFSRERYINIFCATSGFIIGSRIDEVERILMGHPVKDEPALLTFGLFIYLGILFGIILNMFDGTLSSWKLG